MVCYEGTYSVVDTRKANARTWYNYLQSDPDPDPEDADAADQNRGRSERSIPERAQPRKTQNSPVRSARDHLHKGKRESGFALPVVVSGQFVINGY
mgnify:CR=1 FL=1